MLGKILISISACFVVLAIACPTVESGTAEPPALARLTGAEKERVAKLIEGAKKEGKMVWYAAVGGSDSDRLLKGFELRYPFIKAECYRVGAEKLLTKILAEVRADKHLFDVADNGVLEGETLA